MKAGLNVIDTSENKRNECLDIMKQIVTVKHTLEVCHTVSLNQMYISVTRGLKESGLQRQGRLIKK